MAVMLPAVAVKVAVLDPAETFTEAGMLRAVLLVESETAVPPDGAAWLRVTVQAEEPPETKVVGLQAREDTTTGASSEIEAV